MPYGPAARLGDLTSHGSPLMPGTGSTNVLIGSKPAWRALMDFHACPIVKGLIPDVGGIVMMGSPTVLINSMMACRVMDMVVEIPGGPNPIVMGATNVCIGDAGVVVPGVGVPAVPLAKPSLASMPAAAADQARTLMDAATYGVPFCEKCQHVTDELPVPRAETEKPRRATSEKPAPAHWIRIEMLDEADQPLRSAAYDITLPDGKVKSGQLNEQGQLYEETSQPGMCQISFPNLDQHAWGPDTGTAPPISLARKGTTKHSGGSVGSGSRVIKQGECIFSLARDTGHLWETIWNYPPNRSLKQVRGNPNVLLPGDRVMIPPLEPKKESVSTDASHRFRRKGDPVMITVYVHRFDEPMANQPYVLDIENGCQRLTGTTTAEGIVKAPIYGNARCAVLTVGSDPDEQEVFELALGSIDPITEISGVQGRLADLGFECTVTNELDQPTREALRDFQMEFGLEVTGEPDEATRRKLQEEHHG